MNGLRIILATERGGFEPPLSCPKTDFESAAFNRSATSPGNLREEFLQFSAPILAQICRGSFWAPGIGLEYWDC